MSAFAGIGNTKVTNRNPFFEADESYLVEVVKCVHVTSQTSDEFFIIEARIHESSTPTLKPGTVAAQVIKIPGPYNKGFSNVRAFLAAANGIDPADTEAIDANLGVDENGVDQAAQIAVYAVSDDQPLAGKMVRLRTVGTTTKRGTPFTVHNWAPYTEA